MTAISPAELSELRRQMLRFTQLQLRDEASAEDAVQEAMTAAFTGTQNFANRAQLKTWIFAILKNKIVDIIRQRAREPNQQAASEDIPDGAFDELFEPDGHWTEAHSPSTWHTPENHFSNQQFWTIFEICLTRLPEKTARIFMMREMLGLETDEICKELAMSTTNCWVVLHRARMGLRLCLQERWFQETTC